MAITEADRLKRQQNVSSYNNLSPADRLSRVQSVTGKVPDPNKVPAAATTTSPGLQPVQSTVMSPAPPKTPASTVPPEFASWKAKQGELFSKLEGLSNAQFSYNPETDPGYQAQRQLAQLRAGDANRSTMETMNDRGLLQSTVTNSQLSQNAQRAEQEAAAYIPQYREQAYGHFQDRLRSAGELLNYATNQENTQYSRDYQEGRDDVNDAFTEGEMMGSYQSPKVREMVSRITDLGEAWKTGTAEEKAAYHQEAEQLRVQLKGMNYDSSLVGADKTTEQRLANAGKFGQRTLGGQAQDYNQEADKRDFDYKVEYTAERDKVADEKWKTEFDQGKYESDRNYRLNVQGQSIASGQWQQQFNLDVERIGFQQASELWNQAFQENQAGQDDEYRKATLEQEMTQNDRTAANQATDSILKSGLVTTTKDPYTGTETMSVTNPDSLNNYIKSLNLSDNATDSLLYQYGLDSFVKK